MNGEVDAGNCGESAPDVAIAILNKRVMACCCLVPPFGSVWIARDTRLQTNVTQTACAVCSSISRCSLLLLACSS
jgi:hypothetical protein